MPADIGQHILALARNQPEWRGIAHEKFGGFNAKFYDHVFATLAVLFFVNAVRTVDIDTGVAREAVAAKPG